MSDKAFFVVLAVCFAVSALISQGSVLITGASV
jgi:hypothetical protein